MRTRKTRKQRGGQMTLLEASEKGDINAVKELLKNGADPNMRGKENRTPLLEACYKEHIVRSPIFSDIVKLLLEYGADPNLADIHGRTPLHTASALDRRDTAKLLLKYGGDPYLEDVFGKTPLHYIQYRPMHDFFVKYIKAEAARVKLKKLFENEPELGASANRLAKGMIPLFTNANKIYFEEFGSDPETKIPKPWLEGGAKRRKTRKARKSVKRNSKRS
jgi:hypothetical protein